MKLMNDRAPVRQLGARRESSSPETSKIVLLDYVFRLCFIPFMNYVCLNLSSSAIAICIVVLLKFKCYVLLCCSTPPRFIAAACMSDTDTT